MKVTSPLVERLVEEITCYGQTVTRNSTQEWYDSASGDARRRAAEIRKAGLKVSVAPMGSQVTPVGTVKMTLVSIEHGGDPSRVPPVKVERMPR
jgi:hypothetical protein